MSKTLSFSLIVCAFLLGSGFGFFFAPEYAGLKLNPSAMSVPVRDGYTDLRYLNTMAAHHQGALALAQEALAGTSRPEVKDLAAAVIQAKKADLVAFSQWKAQWYGDNKPVSPAGIVHLGNPDSTFDLRFINVLETKITEAVSMSKEVLATSTRAEILTYASELIRVQTGILDQIRTWRSTWYLAGVPNGR